MGKKGCERATTAVQTITMKIGQADLQNCVRELMGQQSITRQLISVGFVPSVGPHSEVLGMVGRIFRGSNGSGSPRLRVF